MAHSLSSVSATLSYSARFNNTRPRRRSSLVRFSNVEARGGGNTCTEDPMPRRVAALVLTGAMLGLNFADLSANAAARRPPPPPPQEKKDPNVSGVQAKVLASKKRKEAMKEAIAKLREKGKPVDQPPPPPPPQ